ncbi:MAG TPA: hypothetical protein VGS08_00045 [Candidatus Saccharimonadales bacterium]|nr:hypothetical protein [Candidatus Saccharimonadales bacterium]
MSKHEDVACNNPGLEQAQSIKIQEACRIADDNQQRQPNGESDLKLRAGDEPQHDKSVKHDICLPLSC